MEKYKREFLEYLEIERGRSIKTIENYDRYLTRFFEYAKISSPTDITESIIRDYRLWLNRQTTNNRQQTTDNTLKKKTQNYYLIALRAFLKYLRKKNIKTVQPEVIELAKTGDRDLDLISHTDLDRLLAQPSGEDVQSLRDKALLELLFSTGMRVSEIVSLSRDIDFSRGEFSVRGKGDKVRVVFVSDVAKTSVKKYLDKRADTDDALFAQLGKNAKNSSDLRLTPRSVERLVKQYAIKAGISKKVTPHIIRHSFATDLLGNGADIRSVQALLGHANIATTQIYTHVTDRHLKEVHKNFHGKRSN
ncbi:MAG: site-specific tyrosine recombinase/integron integrase [Patescibacteria group bacterium]